MSKIIQSHILKQYQIIKQIGKGSYGFVWQVKSKEDNKKYALKKIFDAFRNQTDSQRTYREIQTLTNLQSNYIVKLQKIIPSKGKSDIYLLFQYVDSDLLSLNNLGILKQNQQKYIFYQILLGLKYLHSKSLIHRDLKPANILVNSQSQVKICDFGLVRSSKISLNQQNKTQNVATKWYRAPQVLLGSKNYGIQVDMWSFGCVVAQTLLRKHIINALSTQQIFIQMLQIDKNTTEQDLEELKIQGLHKLIQNSKIEYKNIQKLFGYKHKQFIPLIQGCLKINPKKRFTVQQALNLPLFSQLKEVIKQSDMISNNQQFIFSLDDNNKFDIQTYRKAIMDYIKQNKHKTQQKINSQLQDNEDFQFTQKVQKNIQKRNSSQQNKQNKYINRQHILRNQSLLKNQSNEKLNSEIRNQRVMKSCHLQRPLKKIIDQVYVSQFNRHNTVIDQKSIKRHQSNQLLIQRNIENQIKNNDKLPYFIPQKIYKKPKKIQTIPIKLIKTGLNSQTKTKFFNKFCQRGIVNLTQMEQYQKNQQKQIQQEKELIKKYQMQITTSIYSSFHRRSSYKNSVHLPFQNKNKKFPALSKRVY